MSLAEASWWPGFVASLKIRSLARLSVDLGVPEADLEAELVRTDPGGPATAAPWWPEVVRLRSAVPIRALARRFGCEPRRLRRSLARQGWRAGGVETDRRGVPLLAGMLERLGREPDGTIARDAGVSIEAVQGERKRLRIQPFRPGADLLTAEEEAWVRGPQRQARIRHKVDEEALQVVRRPLRSSDGPLSGPLRGPGVARAPRDERPREGFRREDNGGGERHGPEVVRSIGRGDVRRDEPSRARPDERREELRADPTPRDEGARREDAPRRVGAAFFWEERGRDIDRLLTPASRLRDGRQRIVRAEERREEAPSRAPVSLREVVRPEPVPRPKLPPAVPSWRKVDPTQVQIPDDVVELDVRTEPPPATRPSEPWVPPTRLPEIRREERALPARLVAERRPDAHPATRVTDIPVPQTTAVPEREAVRAALAGEPGAPERTAPKQAAGAGAVLQAPALVTVQSPAEAAPAAVVKVRSRPAEKSQIALPFGAPSGRATPATPAASALTASATAPAARPVDVWEVSVPGAAPMVFSGVDVVTALRLAAARLTPEQRAGLAVVRAGSRPVDLSLPPVAEPLPTFG